jgi:HK97 family phage major capsid protein
MTKLDELSKKTDSELDDIKTRSIAEMHRIHDKAGNNNLTPGENERWTNLTRSVDKIDVILADRETDALAARAAVLARAALNPDPEAMRADGGAYMTPNQTNRSNAPWRSDETDRGYATIDDAFRSGTLPDHAASKARDLIEHGHPGERSLAARWANAAGSVDYRSGFAKLCADPTQGHLLWTPAEQDAYRAATAVHSEMRAMSTTGSAGGYMIPLTLDPAIMLTNAGSINPLRQLASIKQTMTNSWTGISSAGATSEWKAEAVEAADGSPTLANPVIPVFAGDTFVPFSYEVGMDVENFLAELSAIMVDSADNLQATAYTTGNGSTAPQGIVTGLAGTGSELNTIGTEAIAAGDAYAMQNALGARFSANATWQMNIATGNTFRQFETSNGAHAFPELRETPPSLLGKRWHENSNLDGTINAAATANNYVAIYGDIAKAFYIVDRVGTTIDLIPNLMGANGRPTGQKGAFLYFRTGSEVVNPAAAVLLDVPTTA